MYVNVAVIMRFTHRYDHHLQCTNLGQGHRVPVALLNNESRTVAEEATHVLRRMSTMPNVLFATSNAYDWVYMRRGLGVATVPWPGLSVQLSRIEYTGASASARPEMLFCCGAQPYNPAIGQWAALVTNASRRILPNVSLAASDLRSRGFLLSAEEELTPGRGQLLPASINPPPPPPPQVFAWLNDLYPKSFQCKRVKSSKAKSGGGKGGGKAYTEQCGYTYDQVASHPLAILLPYSVHSYGLVNAYAMGLPIVAPSIRLLSTLHAATGIMGHKGPGNVPWRSTRAKPIRNFFMSNPGSWYRTKPQANAPCCSSEPNDACDAKAAAEWLQFSDWYNWPHIEYYDTPEELVVTVDVLLRNATLRAQISAAQKAFFASEMRRAEGHVRGSLHRAIKAARAKQARAQARGRQ